MRGRARIPTVQRVPTLRRPPRRVSGLAGVVTLSALVGLTAVACSDTGTRPDDNDDELPLLLSEIDRTGAVHFSPTWVLWSNGLQKDRWIILPPGDRVDTSDRDHWIFPEGTRILKRFSIEGPDGAVTHVETRILWLHEGTWRTGAYVWNEAQTDAELVVDGSPVGVTVTDQTGRTFEHTVPGRTGCQSCHGSSPAFILGFRELQLNHDGQLAELESRGVFSEPVPADPDVVHADDPETEWMMGYVTANCVHCHNGSAEFDLSHGTFLASTVGQEGPSGDPLILPGDPEASHLFIRFQNRDMPPIGVQVRDDEAVQRMRDWIQQLQGAGVH